MYENKNITIAFSGYNIKNIALLAIDSFLKINPQMKSQILYFDDFSTDWTSDALRQKGIKVISWDKKLLDKYNSIVLKHPQWDLVQKLSVRVSYIIENIIQATETDYLLLNDGDVIFINDSLMENLEESNKNYDIIYQKDILTDPGKSQSELVKKINERYVQKVIESPGDGYFYWRMFHAHIFLNVKKLKELGITSDRLDEETAMLTQGGLFDTFCDFSNRASECGNLRLKEEFILNQNVIHLGGQACEKRGFINGYVILTDPNGNPMLVKHVHRVDLGQPVSKDFVIIDFNKPFNELKKDYLEISHILNNGYTIKDVFLNPNKKIYKILFGKLAGL